MRVGAFHHHQQRTDTAKGIVADHGNAPRDGDRLQLFAVRKRVVINTLQPLGQFHGRKRRTVGKRGRPDGDGARSDGHMLQPRAEDERLTGHRRQAAGQGYAYQRPAPCKSRLIHGFQTVMQRQRRKRLTAVECAFTDERHAGRHVHISQPAFIERKRADRRNTVGKLHRFQRRAAVEHSFRHGGQSAGEGRTRQGAAAGKRRRAHFCQCAGQRHRSKRFAARKSALPDRRHALGQGQACQRAAAGEGFLSNGRNRSRDGHALQLRATVKRPGADGLHAAFKGQRLNACDRKRAFLHRGHAARHGDFRQGGAARKCALSNSRQRSGQADRAQRGTVAERVHSNAGQAGRQINGGQRGVAVEGIRLDRPNRSRQGNGGQFRAPTQPPDGDHGVPVQLFRDGQLPQGFFHHADDGCFPAAELVFEIAAD